MTDASATPSRRDAQRSRRHRTRLVATAVALVLVLGGAAAFLALRDDGATPSASATPTTAAPTTTTVSGPIPLQSATTRGGSIAVFAAPHTTAAPTAELSPVTEYDQPRTLLAFARDGTWLNVHLPTRPNNSTGWIRAADVTLAPLEHSIKIDLAAHKIWLLRNGTVELEADAAIGTPQYPTPTGLYYFTDPVDLQSEPTSSYGAFAIGLSGHSDVLTDFMGSDGQIAIHGTNSPETIGQDVSHGCVRVLNEIVLQLSKLPLGTPVTIV